MFSINVKEKNEKGKVESKVITDYNELSNYINRQLDAKWQRRHNNQNQLSPEQKIKNCVQENKNNSVLLEKSKIDIKTLVNKLSQDELVKLYGLINIFEYIKETEFNRLKGIEKISSKSEQFDAMSTKKAKMTTTNRAAEIYENLEYNVSFNEMKHKKLVNLVYNKIINANTDELKKAIDIRYTLWDKYNKQFNIMKKRENISNQDCILMLRVKNKLNELRKIEEILSEKSLLEAYKVNQNNKAQEKIQLTENNPELKAAQENFEQNLTSDIMIDSDHNIVANEISNTIGNFKYAMM